AAAETRLGTGTLTQFGFVLHIAQPVARNEQVTDHAVNRIVCKREIADLVCSIAAAAPQLCARSHVFHPGSDQTGKKRIRTRFETLQPAFLDECKAYLSESQSSLVVAITSDGDPA